MAQATTLGSEAVVAGRSALTIRTVSGYEEFVALEPVWRAVAAGARLEHPFLEHAWVRTWWESFGAGSRLQVLLVMAGAETIAIAPLIVTRIRMWGLPVRRLGFFYNAHVPRADFLIAQRPREVYRAIWDHLAAQGDWDLLQLCQIQEGSATLEAMTRLAAEAGCGVTRWVSGASPWLTLSGSWDGFFSALPVKHRGNLRNRLRHLESVGPVNLETITGGEALPEGLEAALRLEAAAWKGAAGTAIAADGAVSAFYTAFAMRAAEQGWLRLHFLRAGAARVAFDYSLEYGGRMHLLKCGYDPDYSRYSPYNLLLASVLEELFVQGEAQGYEFLGEVADWKLQWTRRARGNVWLFLFAHSAKGRLLHFIKSRLIPMVKRLRARGAGPAPPTAAAKGGRL